ncbi:hypothetical protein [Massilia aquatica]|uniref:Uncharacterized protein n=1 Tax=Massilia aquatica TaxID=2609000 RepID=A0ABX0MFH4_9BURK|nr:hypothetical protein [Massilia aquatica]NHZ43638.1 hypothetical protein [Massilia aquatica]
MKLRTDPHNHELIAVLERLLAEDETISVRAAARLHPSLKNASAFTRDLERTRVINGFQEKQREFRSIRAGVMDKTELVTKGALATALQRVEELEAFVKTLVAAHVGMITAVTRAGGMSALETFWRDYRDISRATGALQAIPPMGLVIPLRPTPATS